MWKTLASACGMHVGTVDPWPHAVHSDVSHGMLRKFTPYLYLWKRHIYVTWLFQGWLKVDVHAFILNATWKIKYIHYFIDGSSTSIIILSM